MTSNQFNYGAAVPKAEGTAVQEEREISPEERITFLMTEIEKLRKFRYVGRRLRQIAKEGNLMINHPTQGFVLVEDLEQYMLEKL